jgi:hypothetical protein
MGDAPSNRMELTPIRQKLVADPDPVRSGTGRRNRVAACVGSELKAVFVNFTEREVAKHGTSALTASILSAFTTQVVIENVGSGLSQVSRATCPEKPLVPGGFRRPVANRAQVAGKGGL